jgi:hypothetical protein
MNYYLINTVNHSMTECSVSDGLRLLHERGAGTHKLSPYCYVLEVTSGDKKGKRAYFESTDEPHYQEWVKHPRLRPLTLGTAPEPAPAPEPEPIPEPPSKFTLESTTKAGVVSDIALDRINRTNAILERYDIDCSQGLYARGMRTIGWGDGNLKSIIDKHNDSADLIVGLRHLYGEVEKEDRREVIIKDIRSLEMMADGKTLLLPAGSATATLAPGCDGSEEWHWVNKVAVDRLVLEDNGLDKALRFMGAFPYGTGFMKRIKPELRAYNWNSRMETVDKDRQGRFRVRGGAVPTAFSMVSPTFPVTADTPASIRMVIDALKPLGLEGKGQGEGIKGEILYNEPTTELKVTALVAKNEWTDPACEDVFKAGFQVATRDDGQGGWDVFLVAYRNHCQNFIIIEVDKGEGLLGNKGWHNVSGEQLAANAREALHSGTEFMEEFIELWGLASKVEAVDALEIDLEQEPKLRGPARKFYENHEKKGQQLERRIIAELISRPELDAQIANDVLCEAILQGFDANASEGRKTTGTSLNDLINAVTYTHTSNMIDAIQADQLSRAGGRLLALAR